MNKVVVFMLLFFIISGSFVTAFSPASAELTADSWYEKTPMPQPRYGIGVVAVDGKIYVIGGCITEAPLNNNSCVHTNECYDPVTDTWTTLSPMPTPRMTFVIAIYEGKIYCMGGIIGITIAGFFGYPGATDYVTCNVIEVYDPATDSWHTMASSLPIQTSLFVSSQAQVVDGQIFVISGGNVFMYEPTKDLWTTKTGMPLVYRDQLQYNGSLSKQSKNISDLSHYTVVVNGRILVFYCDLGVVDTFDGSFDTFELAWYQHVISYDPKNDVWSEEKTGPSGGSTIFDVGVTTGVYAPQKVYVLKHTGDGDANNWTFNGVYDPFSDKWSTAKSLPVATGYWTIVIIDDVLYAINPSLTYQYIPLGYGTISSAHEQFTLIVAIFAITGGIIVTGLFFYFKKKESSHKKEGMGRKISIKVCFDWRVRWMLVTYY
jgi:MFS family permease